jgi:drug/metabolite transporter (DMT)-like permease
MPSLDGEREIPRRTAGHLALVCAQFCFGLFPVFGRWVFAPGGFTPLAVASWRILFGGLVLGSLAFALHGRRAWLRREDWRRMAACALLGVVLNQALFLEGLQRSTAVNAGLIMCLIPVFTFLLAALARLERFEWSRALGVAIALGRAANALTKKTSRRTLPV